MKVKVGNRTMTLPRDTVASHMANLLTTRAIILQQERDFKTSFNKYKELCMLFLKENKKFVYSFGDEKWLGDFIEFQNRQYSLLMQDVIFRFGDGSTWSVPLNDLANLKMLQEPDLKHNKNILLSAPIPLVEWAQSTLSWDQIRNFAILRSLNNPNSTYNTEWKSVRKKIIVWNYDMKNKS